MSEAVFIENLAKRFGKVQAVDGMAFSVPGEGLLRVEADAPVRVGGLVRFLEERGIEVSEARRMRPSLEDVFVRITGIAADAMRREKEKKGGGG